MGRNNNKQRKEEQEEEGKEREREKRWRKRGEKRRKKETREKKSSPGALSGASGYIIVLRRTVGHRVTRKNTWTVDAQLFVWP